MKLDYITFWRRLPTTPQGARTDNQVLVPEGKGMSKAIDEYLQTNNLTQASYPPSIYAPDGDYAMVFIK